MSFNRRGGYDRRPDRPDRPDRRERPERGDRPPRREGGGDWQPRDRGPGGGGGGSYGGGSYGGGGGGGRSFGGRPRFDRGPDEGGMSIRLDPRRLGALKQLAGDAGVRPGDLVRQWVEERIDAERGVGPAVAAGGFAERLEQLAARAAALEAGAGLSSTRTEPAAETATEAAEEPAEAEEPAASVEPMAADDATAANAGVDADEAEAKPARRTRTNRVSAAPRERVALHDEIIAVLRERGPMTAAELAEAITERGRYTPPRSGKPLDAAMVSQRVSNPAYRARFVREGGRIGLAEIEGT